jgi:hypothetical protein
MMSLRSAAGLNWGGGVAGTGSGVGAVVHPATINPANSASERKLCFIVVLLVCVSHGETSREIACTMPTATFLTDGIGDTKTIRWNQ